MVEAGAAGLNRGAVFRARVVAHLAVPMLADANLFYGAGGDLFEGEGHPDA